MAVTPLYVRYSKLEVTTSGGASQTFDFECSATSIGLTSTGGDLTSLTTLCPSGSFSEVNPRTWALSITAVQDVESEDSFMLFLMDHEGEAASVTWYPKTDASKNPVGRGWTGEVTIAVPDTVGGVEAGNYATFTVELPFQGKPTPIDSDGNPIVIAVPITDVVAGQPGSFVPSDATIPADLGALKIDPTVGDAAWGDAEVAAWATEGDFVNLGDASQASWDGTAWVAGPVPTP